MTVHTAPIDDEKLGPKDGGRCLCDLQVGEHRHPPGESASAMTLTDFLLARIAEDEADGMTMTITGDAYLPEGHTFYVTPTATHPDRWARECQAKRQIVEECAGDISDQPRGKRLAQRVLLQLALPYADHPDYREEWA